MNVHDGNDEGKAGEADQRADVFTVETIDGRGATIGVGSVQEIRRGAPNARLLTLLPDGKGEPGMGVKAACCIIDLER